jgi:hypothetical protein
MRPNPVAIALRQTCWIGCPVPASVRHYIYPQPRQIDARKERRA